MFTIKAVSGNHERRGPNHSLLTTAFWHCDHFRVEDYPDRVHLYLYNGPDDASYKVVVYVSSDPADFVEVYVENEAGKTIDRYMAAPPEKGETGSV